MESLIFDVDGTLWDAVALVAEGWNDGLQSMGLRRTARSRASVRCSARP